MYLRSRFLIRWLRYARWRMAVSLKAIYYTRGCESNEGRWDSRRDMIEGFVEVGIIWMMKVYENVNV